MASEVALDSIRSGHTCSCSDVFQAITRMVPEAYGKRDSIPQPDGVLYSLLVLGLLPPQGNRGAVVSIFRTSVGLPSSSFSATNLGVVSFKSVVFRTHSRAHV